MNSKLSKAIGEESSYSPASQKVCTILSIMANSTNFQCNAFQAVQGFFLESTNTPEHIINVLAHGGWCVSMTSIANIVKTLTKEQCDIIKNLGKDGLCVLVYDNLDFDFKAKEPTLENPGSFTSITTGTFIPLGHGTTLEDLHYSRELWERSTLNPCGPKDISPAQPPSQKYLVKQLQELLP